MSRFIKTLVLTIFMVTILPINVKAAAADSINDFIEKEDELDGKYVTIKGEAIGEGMNRGDYTWININDGSNAIGIWLSKGEAEKVHTYGSYKFIGDTIEITGTFHKACKEHGGEADFHADSIRILKKGYPVVENINFKRIQALLILFILSLLVLYLYHKVQTKVKFEKSEYKS